MREVRRWLEASPPALKRRRDLLFDVLADEPLHQREGLPSGDAHHRLAGGGAVVDVHQVHDDCGHCSRATGTDSELLALKVYFIVLLILDFGFQDLLIAFRLNDLKGLYRIGK